MSVDSVSPWQQVRALQTALFNGVQPQKLLAEALQLLVEQMQVRIGTLLRVERQHDGLYRLEPLCCHQQGQNGPDRALPPFLSLNGDEQPLLQRMLMAETVQRWLAADCPVSLTAKLGHADPCDSVSTLTLHHGGEPIALLWLVDPSADPLPADSSALELLRLTLIHLLLDLNRRRQQQRRHKLAEGCTGALTALAQQRPIDGILTLLADTLVRLFPDRGCLFMRLNRKRDRLEPVAWAGLSAAHVAAVRDFPVDARSICCD